MKPPPKTITIIPDHYHTKFVGWTEDKRQFFCTHPFIPATKDAGREFHTLYLFDASGNLIEAQIDDLGTRAEFNIEAAIKIHEAKLAALGAIQFGRIKVKPFSLERFGVVFGLIYKAPEKSYGARLVCVEPGNYIAFTPPFDSGDYDT